MTDKVRVEYLGKLPRRFGGRAAGRKFRVAAPDDNATRLVSIDLDGKGELVEQMPREVAEQFVAFGETLYRIVEGSTKSIKRASSDVVAAPEG